MGAGYCTGRGLRVKHPSHSVVRLFPAAKHSFGTREKTSTAPASRSPSPSSAPSSPPSPPDQPAADNRISRAPRALECADSSALCGGADLSARRGVHATASPSPPRQQAASCRKARTSPRTPKPPAKTIQLALRRLHCPFPCRRPFPPRAETPFRHEGLKAGAASPRSAHSSFPSSSLGTPLSAKLRFVGVEDIDRAPSRWRHGEAELPKQRRY